VNRGVTLKQARQANLGKHFMLKSRVCWIGTRGYMYSSALRAEAHVGVINGLSSMHVRLSSVYMLVKYKSGVELGFAAGG
jgi:hypothetical protein